MPATPTFLAADFRGDVTLDHVVPATEARFAPLPADLRPELARALATRGIERLYSHRPTHTRRRAAASAPGGGSRPPAARPSVTTCRSSSACSSGPTAGALRLPDERPRTGLAAVSALKHGLPIDLVSTPTTATLRPVSDAIREAGHIVMTNPTCSRRPAPASHALAPAVLESRLRRHRRAAHIPRIVRQPGRQCDPALEEGLRLLRIEPDIHLHVRDNCQSSSARPEVAGGGKHRARGAQRRAPRRAQAHLLQPSAAESRGGRRSSMLEARRIAAPWIRPGVQTIVLPQPPAGRGDAQLPAPGPRHASTPHNEFGLSRGLLCFIDVRSRRACAAERSRAS